MLRKQPEPLGVRLGKERRGTAEERRCGRDVAPRKGAPPRRGEPPGRVLADRTAVVVESPTLDLDKPAIAAAALRLGLGPADFWSCYRDGDAPCGRCESCLRSQLAFARARGPSAP